MRDINLETLDTVITKRGGYAAAVAVVAAAVAAVVVVVCLEALSPLSVKSKEQEIKHITLSSTFLFLDLTCCICSGVNCTVSIVEAQYNLLAGFERDIFIF